MKRVLTVGVFDLLHWGHFELLRRAKELAGEGGRLIVGLHRDEALCRVKPGVKLTYDYDIRKSMILALRYVDEVVPHEDVEQTVQKYEFDILAVGGDQKHPGFMRAIEWCRCHGKQVISIGRTDGISSSIIRQGALK